jgi:AGCS family alanine or glycine:cation symporter
MVYLNIPILLLGAPLVYKALKHYRETRGGKFISRDIGIETEHWTEENQRHL